MGIFSGLLSAYSAGKKEKNPYKPNVRTTRDLERWATSDIRSLYRTSPIPGEEYAGYGYEGPGLGYSEAEMEGKFGEGRDLIAGEAGAERQRTADRFRSPGGLGLSSGMYARAQQRSDLAAVSRGNEFKRRMIIENAQQKRADKLARIAAVTGYYGQETGLYNQYVSGRNARYRRFYGGAGEFADSIMTGGAGGVAAGG